MLVSSKAWTISTDIVTNKNPARYSRVPAENSYGLLAPLYLMEEKRLYLFSHHTEGLVWQVIHKTTFREEIYL